MRAWHLLLAVLATLLTIVQVASTEDNTISSRFIKAIQPIKKDIYKINQNIELKPIITAIMPTATETALMDFNNNNQQQSLAAATTTITTLVYKPHKKSVKSDRKHKQQQHKQKHIQQVQVQQNNIPRVYYENNNSNNSENDYYSNDENIHQINVNIDNDDKYIHEIATNDLNENENAIEVTNYIENLTEDKESLKLSKQNKKQNKMSNININDINNNNVNLEQIVQVQENQKIIDNDNRQNINQKLNAMDKESNALVQEQQTEPASQPQQQQHHHPHRHHHHEGQQHHHHQHHKQQQQQQHETITPISSSINELSDNLSSSSSTTTTTSTPTFPQMDIDDDIERDSDSNVVAEDDEPQVDAVIPEDGPRTYSNKEIIGDKVKPDPSTLVEIENSLLSLFNMKRPPKIDRSKIIIPEAMKQLYAQIMGHELNSVNIPKPGLLTKSANTVRSFTHQDSKIDDRFPHHHRFRLYFDIKSIPAEEKLKAAELQLTRDAISHASLNPRLANRTRYQVLVYDITRVGVRGKREPSYLLLDNKTIRLNSTDTVSLDVQPAVDRWLASPKRNFGLLVEVRTSRSLKPAPHHHVRLRRSADEEHGTWQHKQPLLFTYTDDGRHKSRSIRDVSTRSKRAGGGNNHHRRSHRRKNNEAICRRHSLYVDFADVGWSDWIVAPPGYDAFYCQGKCPFPLADHLNSTNHAVVQTIVNNIDPFKVPTACCVPTQLEGISMLYLNDQSTVVLKNYQDMTVVGCGCR